MSKEEKRGAREGRYRAVVVCKWNGVRWCVLGWGGVSIQYTRSGRYMKACHIAKVEVWSLLVQTVTSRAGPKHFQMSANSVTGAASLCS